MTASPFVPASGIAIPPLTVYHCGFAVALVQQAGRYGARSFAFEIRHQGLLLHASPGAYASASSAERAARVFVDDAVGAFEHAHAEADA
jgi:hypothetical protein